MNICYSFNTLISDLWIHFFKTQLFCAVFTCQRLAQAVIHAKTTKYLCFSPSAPNNSDESVHANVGGSFIQSENASCHLRIR